jgi:hypothetical protein
MAVDRTLAFMSEKRGKKWNMRNSTYGTAKSRDGFMSPLAEAAVGVRCAFNDE